MISTIIPPSVPPSDDIQAAVDSAKKRPILPVLDVGPFLARQPGALEQLASNVRLIGQELGFFLIINHGVSEPLIRKCFSEVEELFRLPHQVKMKYRAGYNHQGYIPPKASLHQSQAIIDKIGLNLKKDTNSAWVFMRERTADDEKVKQGVRHRGLNRWPDNMPLFRRTLTTYIEKMSSLSGRMLPVWARALGLPPNFFDGMFKCPEYYQRCGHYTNDPNIDEGQFALSPHSDGSLFTLLPMTKVPGLEVMRQDHSWFPVQYVDGCLIVNTGQILSRLTNDKFIATPHRVVNPPRERYCLTYFVYPDDDAPIGPIRDLLEPGEQLRYDDRTFYEFFVPYLDELYHYNDDAWLADGNARVDA